MTADLSTRTAATTGTGGHDPRQWRGIFTIPATPFAEDGALDLDDLRRNVEFSVECGAHGIVHPVMASEFFVLSEAERLQMIPLVAQWVAGRCPVVIGVSGVSTQAAVPLARAARDAGADAVIAMPPYVQKYSDEDVLRYFAAISRAVKGLPIFVQNAGMAAVGHDHLLKIVREVEGVHFVKEEVAPALVNMSRLIDVREPGIWGVFGGHGCQHLFSELRRGAVGNMPVNTFTDVFVRMFELWEAGQQQEAEALHRRLMPLITRSGPAKEALVRRGVIRSAKTRAASGAGFDSYDRAEVDTFWPELEAAFTWRPTVSPSSHSPIRATPGGTHSTDG
jgi:dihydrodipicolinate synthase/N-acetylneuraminate lyase